MAGTGSDFGYCRKNEKIQKVFYKKTGQASKSLTCFVSIGMWLRMIPVSSDPGFALRSGYGIIWDIVLGILGGALGGWLFEKLNISWGGLAGQIGTAVVGAVILIAICRMIAGKK
jgi:uncharacterized membrane protein YeaQ/YmgE (transglycosylase-associated protein family)